jgi:plastocyanin
MLRSSFPMKKIDKELFPLVQAVSIIIILVAFPYYSAVAQDDEGGEEVDIGDTNSGNDNDDSSFSVTIPENAAWSENIDQKFDPTNITIPVGSEVTWINEDSSQHTVTSGNLTDQGFDGIYDGRFYSGTLGSEDSFSHTFNEPGIYSYFCSPHPWMIGFVTVDDQDANIQGDDDEDSTDDQEEQDEDEDEDEDNE